MSTSKTLILALSSALLAVACGSDNDEASPDSGPAFTNPDASVRADAGGGGKDTGSTEEDTDGGVVEEGDAGEVDPDSGELINCDGPGGCYACTPKTSIQFLNQCVSADAGIAQVPFDNQARIPGYDPSKLPDLP